MKLLYTVIILPIIVQLVLRASSVLGAVSSNSLLAKNQLVEFYGKEINALSRETCVKFSNMSAQILEDRFIKGAKTPLIMELKRNMTHFQEVYPIYMRYGLNKELLLIFSSATINYFYREPTAESQYIVKLLRKLGYDEIFDQFESNFVKFATSRFRTKFEEFKSHIPANETKQFQNLLQWGEEMRKCQRYACFYKHFNSFDQIILTPKQQLLAYVNQQLKKINAFYGHSGIQIARGVSQSRKLPQLPPGTRRMLIQIINNYIAKYESTKDTDQLYGLSSSFYRNVLLPFYNNSHIPKEERQLLIEIFDEAGYARFQLSYYKKFKEFIELGLLKRFENFRASLSEEEMAREKALLEWFEKFKHLSSYEDRTEALKAMFTFS